MIGRRALLVLAVRLVTAFLSFLGLYFITNYLGAEIYGTLAFTLSLVAAFNAFADFGFNQAHIKKLSEGHDITDCVSTFIAIKVALTGITVLITFVSIAAWTIFFEGSLNSEEGILVILFVLYYVFYDLASIAIVTYYGKLEIAKAQIIILADPLIRVPLIIIIAVGGGGVIQLASAYVISGILIVLVAFVFLLRDGSIGRRWILIRPYFHFALPLALVTVV